MEVLLYASEYEEILVEVKKNKKAVGAFNVPTLENVRAVRGIKLSSDSSTCASSWKTP
ncbi:hypothetical protein LQF60_06465 [Tetragenococcus koreensis]|uniref:hypothetical protein n=1 Tax=Tetragenococcus koreensis TaxID=290335 RepID=UPI001F16EBF2|nr:hypothetical protein [Tetragenococcus koreensis]MCF1629478.1 hypothetical protein [Tetragenococcus koreensis]MCF1656344.1 hypothetical protein [Tetragenococcus koreensis]MDN6733399.1 hypothetical protein [Tetragenococcus koreensis]